MICHGLYLVKPDASQDEIRAAFEDNSGGQIFSQAVSIHDLQLDFVHFAEVVLAYSSYNPDKVELELPLPRYRHGIKI